MPTFKLTLAYEGTRFAGWAKQPNALGVQTVVEAAIGHITGETVRATGASRTDAGVHAFGQLVSFTTAKEFPPDDLRKALNAVLPGDVLVRAVETAPDDFDAIKAARRKRYRYLIRDTKERGVFDRLFAWNVRYPLDDERLREAAQAFVGTHDFASFQTTGAERRSTVRTIYEVSIYRGGLGLIDPLATTGDVRADNQNDRGELLAIEIEGNGFLYNMVRSIAGTLYEVGRGKRPTSWPAEIIAAKNRSVAGQTAPAHGLFLLSIKCETETASVDAPLPQDSNL